MTICTDRTIGIGVNPKALNPIKFLRYIKDNTGDYNIPAISPNEYEFIDKIANLNDDLCIVECYNSLDSKGTSSSSKYLAKWNDGVAE